ncbi:MAG: hypothetical protein P8Z72_14780 [Gammaproteobacteria bacterium]
MQKRLLPIALAAVVVIAIALNARAETENGHQHQHSAQAAQHGDRPILDKRTLVHFPEKLRVHTLANMRDHLLTLGEIQAAMANKAFDKAADIAEQRLGMTSMKLHGAHEVARYMPEGMRKLGTAMHRSASRFAVIASNAGVSQNPAPALAALSRVTQACVACHSSYRLH